VAGQDLQPGSNQLRESKIITERSDEKIEVEIREVLRVRPQDFGALKNSFEAWVSGWE
jgi:hypothetical protein